MTKKKYVISESKFIVALSLVFLLILTSFGLLVKEYLHVSNELTEAKQEIKNNTDLILYYDGKVQELMNTNDTGNRVIAVYDMKSGIDFEEVLDEVLKEKYDLESID